MRLDIGAWSLLLIAIGIGYLVCLKASKEGTKLFKNAGYAIGIIILVAGMVLVVCDLGTRITRSRRTAQRRTQTRSARPVPMVDRERLMRRGAGLPVPEKPQTSVTE
ncbi:MAG: hypothetical protein ISS26_08190 [Candidatus Omnitrophica bacterium]|nr:hypothetical protein [Candidatus Omnitrophota bacterium]